MTLTRIAAAPIARRNRNIRLTRRRIRLVRTVAARVLPVRTVRTYPADTLLPRRTGHAFTRVARSTIPRSVRNLTRRTPADLTFRTRLALRIVLPRILTFTRRAADIVVRARHSNTAARAVRNLPRRTVAGLVGATVVTI